MIIYRIKNTETGLYSRGGNSPMWSKTGKVWKSIGHVKSHLRNTIPRSGRYTNYASKWVIESCEIKEELINEISAEAIIQEMVDRENAKEKKYQDELDRRNELKKRALNRLTEAERKALGV